ncbi:uncharacterized protein LOC100518090 [Sus scrofa]|uniref:uncharacterized protein LOC100518090 n=1 Tax=Sus scrofa TaxID=9823 RepID=UPI000A2B6266|nr:uncharacterized protein LOC100518090 [Sus scrofa]
MSLPPNAWRNAIEVEEEALPDIELQRQNIVKKIHIYYERDTPPMNNQGEGEKDDPEEAMDKQPTIGRNEESDSSSNMLDEEDTDKDGMSLEVDTPVTNHRGDDDDDEEDLPEIVLDDVPAVRVAGRPPFAPRVAFMVNKTHDPEYPRRKVSGISAQKVVPPSTKMLDEEDTDKDGMSLEVDTPVTNHRGDDDDDEEDLPEIVLDDVPAVRVAGRPPFAPRVAFMVNKTYDPEYPRRKVSGISAQKVVPPSTKTDNEKPLSL